MNLNVDLKKNENLMTFSLAYLNVNLILIFLSMVNFMNMHIFMNTFGKWSIENTSIRLDFPIKFEHKRSTRTHSVGFKYSMCDPICDI